MAKKRTDAERRLRQCERLGRLLRVLHCISGPGRWDADALAKELECSRRTVHRLMQTLSMAGVPWYFDEVAKAYKVRSGFRFSLSEQSDVNLAHDEDQARTLLAAQQLLKQAEGFVAALRSLCDNLNPPHAATSQRDNPLA